MSALNHWISLDFQFAEIYSNMSYQSMCKIKGKYYRRQGSVKKYWKAVFLLLSALIHLPWKATKTYVLSNSTIP